MNIYNKIKSEKALTLSELLVSAALIGIVMMGVMGFNYAMKAIEDTSSKASRSAIRAAAALAMLKKDTERAIGDVTDKGIRYGTNGSGVNSICFRYECASSTPADYSDDCWFCYWRTGTTLTKCQATGVGVVPIYTATGNCQPNTTINLVTLASPIIFYNVNALISAGMTRIQSVDFTIRCKDNAAIATDPLSNPEQIFTTRVMPLSHSQ